MTPTDDVSAALALVDRALPRLGGAHLLCVDGPSGSGKTTFADGLVAHRPGAVVVHLDELMDGWDGLADAAGALASDVLEPLSTGRPAAWRRYDWVEGTFAERVPVHLTPGDLLVVEGVGSGDRVTDPYRSALVWLEAPVDVRRTRALARPEDGEAFAAHWSSWAAQESAHHAAQATRSYADLVLRIA